MMGAVLRSMGTFTLDLARGIGMSTLTMTNTMEMRNTTKVAIAGPLTILGALQVKKTHGDFRRITWSASNECKTATRMDERSVKWLKVAGFPLCLEDWLGLIQLSRREAVLSGLFPEFGP